MSCQPRNPVTFGQGFAAFALIVFTILGVGGFCYAIAAVAFTPFPPKEPQFPRDASPDQMAATTKAHAELVAAYREEIGQAPYSGWHHPAAFAWGGIGMSAGLLVWLAGILIRRFGGP